MKSFGLKETIDWYDNNADKYSLGTRDQKFSDTAKSFLDKISLNAPKVLDAGCGDGRDSATLASFGASVTGIDKVTSRN
jgi:2-polyprenyl-3-methyl-5-hydroxy-6-metoxy-1,4-benzoquinol methylase